MKGSAAALLGGDIDHVDTVVTLARRKPALRVCRANCNRADQARRYET
jgi:hypothetical protein